MKKYTPLFAHSTPNRELLVVRKRMWLIRWQVFPALNRNIRACSPLCRSFSERDCSLLVIAFEIEARTGGDTRYRWLIWKARVRDSIPCHGHPVAASSRSVWIRKDWNRKKAPLLGAYPARKLDRSRVASDRQICFYKRETNLFADTNCFSNPFEVETHHVHELPRAIVICYREYYAKYRWVTSRVGKNKNNYGFLLTLHEAESSFTSAHIASDWKRGVPSRHEKLGKNGDFGLAV